MSVSTPATGERVLPADVMDYLRRHHVVTVSTSSFTGLPHADTVVYANDQRAFYFYAAPGTQMVRNINDSHHVSVTIDDYTTDWRKVRELQGVGRCQPAAAEDLLAADAAFDTKYGANFARPAGSLYRTVPSQLHFVDYDYDALGAEPRIQTFQMADVQHAPKQGAIATSLDRLEFQAGDTIFESGHNGGQYYVVLDGQVEVRNEGFGVDQTVVRVAAGELFGDLATLRGQPGAYSAHAVTPTVLLAVDRHAMRDLLFHPIKS